MHPVLRLCAAAATALVFATASTFAHEGHDHGEAPSAPVDAAPRTEAISDDFELVAVARAGQLEIYIDRRPSNEPVIDANVTVETPSGSVVATPVTERGTYAISSPWAQQGTHDLIFTIVAGGTTDVLTATLEIPAGAAGPASPGWVGRIAGLLSRAWTTMTPATAISALVGGLLGAGLTRWTARRRVATVAIALAAMSWLLSAGSVLAHEGEDHGETERAPISGERDLARRVSDGTLFVPKATQRILAIRTSVTAEAIYRRTIELPGRIVPDPNASGLVQAAVGGRLSPPDGGFPRLGTRVNKGDVLAYVTPPIQAIDLSDMRQRQGELDQQISIVERRIARFEQLVQKGAVTQVQLDEARLELQGLNDRRAALDRIRQQPEALTAPVSGVVAEVNAAAGQMAQTNIVLFQIVEPSRLWVEALSFDALSAANNANAKTGSGRILPVSYQGSGFSDRSQSVPIHFRIESETSGLRLGQFVTVFAETDDEKRGIALPRASIVRTQNGQDLVFEHGSAERFVPRPVRIEPLDGERVLVVSGVGAGARIVTQGAELLDQVR